MHLFARNGHTSSKTRDLKVGITQIDPRGSYGPKKSDASEYRAVRPLDFSQKRRGATRRKILMVTWTIRYSKIDDFPSFSVLNADPHPLAIDFDLLEAKTA